MTLSVWIADLSGMATIITVVVPFLVRIAIKPVIHKMLEDQNKLLTDMVDRRITKHEDTFHKRGTFDGQRVR